MTRTRTECALDVTIGFAAVMLVGACVAAFAGCAALPSATDEKRVKDDTAAQVQCAADAGTREEWRTCLCAVRARYPEGNQCDGGVWDGGAK